ncbi:protein-L-isoaspartate O-methyltransferase [Candidatus Pacearchaeota archaeon]|nr:protein-L-isoaspartate O-methyltransferase [Candidatus Pacearchaeota archaeon]
MNQKEILLQSLKEKKFSSEILEAFSKVKRENFIPEDKKNYAYQDIALPIGLGQTISQPYTIAVMLSLLKLKKRQRVLEIGSGCGYALALISEIVGKKGKVFGLEVREELVKNSKKNLKNHKNIEVYHGDGNFGLKDKAPFDRILISAAAQKIPERLVSQLKQSGIIVAPIGKSYESTQTMTQFVKSKNKLVVKEKIPGFLFVPLLG